MKNILLTRAINQSQELNSVLQDAGFNVVCEALFNVKKSDKVQDCRHFCAAIITSANACEALMKANLAKETQIFAVGKKTARDLMIAGFLNIQLAPETSADSLKDLIRASDFNKNAKIAYFHGSHITLDFQKELKELNITNILAYRREEKNVFSDNLLKNSQKKYHFDYVLLFSRNSAEIFNTLARQHNMLEYFSHAKILCLSKKILDDVRAFGFINSATFEDLSILKKFYD